MTYLCKKYTNIYSGFILSRYVLPNHMLLQIAEALPREMQGILACCNPIPPLMRQNLGLLHRIVLRAREQPLVQVIKMTKSECCSYCLLIDLSSQHRNVKKNTKRLLIESSFKLILCFKIFNCCYLSICKLASYDYKYSAKSLLYQTFEPQP